MSISQATLGQRLREAREASRVSQVAAAEALGLQRATIAHMEAGNRSISTMELVEFARLYHRDVAWFFSDKQAEVADDALLTLYRVDAAFRDAPAIQDTVSRCLDLCLEGAALEELLDTPKRGGPPAYLVDQPRNASEAVHQGEWVAAQERNRAGIGHAPISDMAGLITSQGVWAAAVDLPDQMSGLFLRHPSIGMAVLVNSGHHRNRRRFSYAHEYGHCLMDREEGVSVTRPENQANLHEMRANAFAAAFLMPEGGVSAFLASLDKGGSSRQTLHVVTPAAPSSADSSDDAVEAEAVEIPRRPAPGSQKIVCQDVAQLACHFRVSYKAAAYRLRGLDRISHVDCSGLLRRDAEAGAYLRVLGMVEKEVAEGPRRFRQLENVVAYLAVEAYRRSVISRGRLQEIAHKLQIEAGGLDALAKAASA